VGLFVNLQNIRKINKESGPHFLKILDSPLNLAALTAAAIEILILKINWTKFP
jgi:hypothetical protein